MNYKNYLRSLDAESLISIRSAKEVVLAQLKLKKKVWVLVSIAFIYLALVPFETKYSKYPRLPFLWWSGTPLWNVLLALTPIYFLSINRVDSNAHSALAVLEHNSLEGKYY